MSEENLGIDDSYKLALKYYMDDHLEKSLNIAKSLLKNDAQNPKFNHLLGIILVKLGNYNDSLSFLYFSAKEQPQEMKYLKSYKHSFITKWKSNIQVSKR